VSAGIQANLMIYPKNGQTQDQLSTDRRDCEQWAARQVGTSGSDYQRAMVACVQGRGYAVN
jgi:hypothetical protein